MGRRAYLICFSISLAAGTVFSAESICPGGSSPRSDIAGCWDFEDLTGCATGAEAVCMNANGINSSNQSTKGDFKIEAGDAAVGNGAIVARGSFASTGLGYMHFPISPSTSVNYRYYVKYHGPHMTYGYDHGPGIQGSNDSGAIGGTMEQSQYNYYWYLYAGNISPNLPNPPVLQNGRWYLIEMHRTADGANGKAKMWVDEQLVLDSTLDWGAGATWNQLWGPRSYYHMRVPFEGHGLSFDNFAVSTNGTYIGPAENENPRGTPDPKSPYANYNGAIAFAGGHISGDCSEGSSYLKEHGSQQWRDGGVLQADVAHGLFEDQCNHSPVDRAMLVDITGASGGGGIAFELNSNSRHTFPAQVIHGWINLPLANDYSNNPSLCGYVAYSCGSSCDGAGYGKQVALTVENGKWAIKQRLRKTNENASIAVTSDVFVDFDNWQELEMILWNDTTLSLMVDRQRIFEKVKLPMPASFMFRDGSSAPKNVVGVIDFEGTGPFKAYFDDFQVGTASYWSCDGWDSVSCPFANTAIRERPSPNLISSQRIDGGVEYLGSSKAAFAVRVGLPSDFQLQVVDVMGRQVWSKNVANKRVGAHRVDWQATQSSGAYFVEMAQGNMKVRKQFVVFQ